MPKDKVGNNKLLTDTSRKVKFIPDITHPSKPGNKAIQFLFPTFAPRPLSTIVEVDEEIDENNSLSHKITLGS